MLDEKVLSILNDIADSIKEAGLDPYEQLYGYATTVNELYITRCRGARERIRAVDVADIVIFVKLLEQMNVPKNKHPG